MATADRFNTFEDNMTIEECLRPCECGSTKIRVLRPPRTTKIQIKCRDCWNMCTGETLRDAAIKWERSQYDDAN